MGPTELHFTAIAELIASQGRWASSTIRRFLIESGRIKGKIVLMGFERPARRKRVRTTWSYRHVKQVYPAQIQPDVDPRIARQGAGGSERCARCDVELAQ
jgi:hypothetical protein